MRNLCTRYSKDKPPYYIVCPAYEGKHSCITGHSCCPQPNGVRNAAWTRKCNETLQRRITRALDKANLDN